MAGFQAVGPLADAHKLDGDAGNPGYGQGRPAAGIAVHFGHYQAGQPYPLMKLLGGVHRILAGHRVHRQQGLVGGYGGLDFRQFRHQVVVDVQAAAGVNDGPSQALLPGQGNAIPDYPGYGGGFGILGMDGNIQLTAQGFQLGNGRRAAQVGRHQEGGVALAAQVQGQFGGGSGFAGPLQADQHQHGGQTAGGGKAVVAAAEDGGQFLVDDFDHLLAGGEAFQDGGVQGAFLDFSHKVPGYPKVHIGFQQGTAHLPQGVVNILFGQAAFAGKPVKDAGQLVGQVLKH